MIKILFYLPYLSGGGAQRVFVNLLNGLNKNKFKPVFVVINPEGPFTHMIPCEVKLVELPATRVVFSIIGLAKIIRQEKPDCVVSGLNYANVAAIAAVKLSRLKPKIIVTEHNHYSINIRYLNYIYRRLFTYIIGMAYKYADYIVCVSNGVKENLIKSVNLHKYNGNFRVIYNPIVDKNIYKMQKEPVQHEWLNKPDFKVLLAVGRLETQKAYPTLIKAFSLLKKNDSTLKLIILGEGKKRAELIGLIKELGLSDEINLPGFVKNPFAYMASADLFVLSSVFEGFANVIVEAMACGLPVIATDCPSGPGEIIEDGVNGLLVPVGNYRLLAEKIQELLHNRTLRLKLIANGLERAKDFEVGKITKEYEKLFV